MASRDDGGAGGLPYLLWGTPNRLPAVKGPREEKAALRPRTRPREPIGKPGDPDREEIIASFIGQSSWRKGSSGGGLPSRLLILIGRGATTGEVKHTCQSKRRRPSKGLPLP